MVISKIPYMAKHSRENFHCCMEIHYSLENIYNNTVVEMGQYYDALMYYNTYHFNNYVY